MGKKGGWFSALKKALSPKKSKSKKWGEKGKNPDSYVSSSKETTALPVPSLEPHPHAAPPPPPPPPPLPQPPPPSHVPIPTGDAKLDEGVDEQSTRADSVLLAAAVSAEATAMAAAEVVPLTALPPYSGKSKEEIAVIKIQTAFRGYLARRGLRALRGLVRLKSLIQGQSAERQATSTLQAMQTLGRVQSQIRARRIRLTEENHALQRQLQHRRQKQLHKSRVSSEEVWDDSTQSKEQIEATLAHRQEAAMRRERAMAYAFSHQQSWKNSQKPAAQTFMDPNSPQWGWSWLARWMADRPWDSRTTVDNDQSSVETTVSRTMSVGEISRAHFRRDISHDKLSPGAKKPSWPGNRRSPSTPPSRAPSTAYVTSRTKPPSLREDEDSGSQVSVQSEVHRRHSILGSSVRDDESLASSASVPSFMARTQSVKAKSRLPSPLGSDRSRAPEKLSVHLAKKRLSFSASGSATRRHSGPPRMDHTVLKDINVKAEGNDGR